MRTLATHLLGPRACSSQVHAERDLSCAGLELSSAEISGQLPSSDRRWTQLAQLIPDLRASSGELHPQDAPPEPALFQAQLGPRSRRPSTRSGAGGPLEQQAGSAAHSPSVRALHQGAPPCAGSPLRERMQNLSGMSCRHGLAC